MQANSPATREFTLVPECDQQLPHDQQSRFTFRPMTMAERLRSWDEMQVVELRSDGTKILHDRGYQQAREIALACLVRVDNFPANAPQAYDPRAPLEAREAFLNRIPDVELLRLANQVRERSVVDATAGNS